ncbi:MULTISPECIES: hypothetical protein [Paenibacillus]|uniref:hypothetical protein n=1 Tax=Paenibacillus TaxID=44249 RepID=UPI00096F8EC4|nr:hypothetical protein [Paenibacillus odorifer]OMD75300.1 hypothetical protein BSK50_19055 [Paenibacillus odorifer]
MNNNIVFYVETERTDRGNECVVHKIDLNEGYNFMPKRFKGNFQELSAHIDDEVFVNKPTQIVFEGSGAGIGLKDTFFDLIKKNDFCVINEKGRLYYSY